MIDELAAMPSAHAVLAILWHELDAMAGQRVGDLGPGRPRHVAMAALGGHVHQTAGDLDAVDGALGVTLAAYRE
jgi:hypothetical protein